MGAAHVGSAGVEVLVLGPAQVTAGGEAVTVERPLERALLVRLALATGTPVADERLTADLWGDAEIARPAERLRVLASRLRRALGPHAGALSRTHAGYALDAAPRDLLAARSAADALAAARRANDPAAARSAATEAVAMWRGPALGDMRGVAFAAVEGERLDAWRLDLLVQRLTADLALGAAAEVVTELDRLATENPLHESICGLLALALYRSGRQTDALDRLARMRRTLADELGVDLGPALADLELRMLRHDPALVEPAPGPATQPPITEQQPQPRRKVGTRLPSPTTTFVGRDADLAALIERLGEPRLITLVGGPGAGKSRLAVEAASTVAATGRRAVFVELAPLHPTASVSAALGAAVGVTPSADPLPAIAAALGGALLVLDNAEHVVEQVGELVTALRRHAEITVLVSSQRPLLLADEEQHRIGPLGAQDAAMLFRQRISVDAEPADVATICTAVDRLPLGIELAAGLTRTLSVAQLAVRMPDRLRLLVGGHRDAGSRHTSMRTALAWSHDLLGESERTLLRRAAVFSGGFELEAAEQVVAGAPLAHEDVAQVLADLVDRSLVTAQSDRGRRRFALLETVREYALEQLAAAGETEKVRGEHLAWCRGLAREADPGIIESEWPNLLEALEQAPRSERSAEGLRLALALHWQWQARGQYEEERRHLAALVGAEGARLEDQCWALLFHGLASALVGEIDEVAQLLARTCELAARTGNAELIMTAHLYLGTIEIQRDHATEGLDVLEIGRAVAAKDGNARFLCALTEMAATAHLYLGDGKTAMKRYEEAAAIGEGQPREHVFARGLSRLAPEAAMDVVEGIATFAAAANIRMGARWEALRRAAATDPDLDAALQHCEQLARLDNRLTVALLAERGVLRSEVPVDELGDLLWMVMRSEQCQRLMGQAGWSEQRYTDWLRRAAVQILLPGPGAAAGLLDVVG